MLYTAFFFAIFLLLYVLLLIPIEKKSQIKRRVDNLLINENKNNTLFPSTSPLEQKNKESFRKRALVPFWLETKKSLSKRTPGKQAEKLDKQLVQAGNPFQMKGADYRIIQLAFLFGMPIISIIYGVFLDQKELLFVFLLTGLGIGVVLPRYYIKSKISKRQKQAILELPDFVDLLLVSLEAGLGFDSALSKVTGKQDGVLAKEFGRCLEELRLGLTRSEALIGVRERLDVEEISVFINNILRAGKLGVGMVQVLRILTSDVRDRRRQRAEEMAMKAPIKMLFPLVFLIFPSLFIVILGPAVIQLINQFM